MATRDDLEAEGHAAYPLPFQALGRPPLPRMNLRAVASEQLSLALTKESGEPLARRKANTRQVDGQAFRTPHWIAAESARSLRMFLDALWEAEDYEGIDGPVRVSRGLAPTFSAAERKAIERRAMHVVCADYRRSGYDVVDVSDHAPWDLAATHASGHVAHIEVKGTTGSGRAVTVTAGERRHATEFAHPALAIVTGIALVRGRKPAASGGKLSTHLTPWSVDDGAWSATVYRYEPPVG